MQDKELYQQILGLDSPCRASAGRASPGFSGVAGLLRGLLRGQRGLLRGQRGLLRGQRGKGPPIIVGKGATHNRCRQHPTNQLGSERPTRCFSRSPIDQANL